MADDPLSVFRRKLAVPKPQASAAPSDTAAPRPSLIDGREAYDALHTRDRPAGLRLRRRKGVMSYAIMYNYLHSLAFDDDDNATCLFLQVSGYHIEIHGRNLGPIADAILLGSCSAIQEFRADRFILPQPIDHAAPFVESISVEILHGNGEREAG